jgi:hypothetical protein
VSAERSRRADYGPTLALAVTLAAAAFLVLMPLLVLRSHPRTSGLGAFTGLVNQQNQSTKSLLYLVTFVLILPLSVIVAPPLSDAVRAGPNAAALSALVAALAASLASVLIAVRLSGGLPWGDGLRAVLGGTLLWWVAAAAGLLRAIRGGSWPALLRTGSWSPDAWRAVGVLVFVVLLCVTRATSLHAVPLAIGALITTAVLVAWPRLRVPRANGWPGGVIDLVVVVLLALAIPNVIVFHATGGQLPNIYAPPGVLANQQNYLLGSANQLLGGGALLVNVPVSQYGVGLIYFMDGWFHLAPIGYGTAGLLDSLLTALFYIVGYCTLRIAGVERLLAAGALAVGLMALIYGMYYGVGALPETGPLRFGLPIALVLARVAQARWPSRSGLAGTAALGVLGLSAVWALEAFAYTAVTFAAIAAVQAWLRPSDGRRRWLIREAALGLGACLAAHLLLALVTLLVTGSLPDWGQYLTYIRSFLFGGIAGAISYGFSAWSPGLAVGGAALASAAAIVLLVRRAPRVARGEPVTLIALTGATAYAIALLSYTDNRSLTYLLPYVTLPLLIAATLWLAMLLRRREDSSSALRKGGLGFALALSVLMISAAWPSIGHNLSETALARAYPAGGLRAALHRLWHPPPIDPRAPEGVRLLDRYVPGRRALVVLPIFPDLGVEILMRARRTNTLFIGDPVDDSLVPSLWIGRLTAEVARLRAGQRLLIDRGAETVLAGLRAHPAIDPAKNPIAGGNQQLEWLLLQIDRRFRIQPIYRDRDGLIVAELASRQG